MYPPMVHWGIFKLQIEAFREKAILADLYPKLLKITRLGGLGLTKSGKFQIFLKPSLTPGIQFEERENNYLSK